MRSLGPGPAVKPHMGIQSFWSRPTAPARTRPLAHDPFPVAIPRVPIRRMGTRHRCNVMPPRLRAGDAAVPVVVAERECIVPVRGWESGAGARDGRRCAHDGLQRSASARSKNMLERRGLGPVDGEPVGPAHLDAPPCELAPLPRRQPMAGVPPALLEEIDLQGPPSRWQWTSASAFSFLRGATRRERRTAARRRRRDDLDSRRCM